MIRGQLSGVTFIIHLLMAAIGLTALPQLVLASKLDRIVTHGGPMIEWVIRNDGVRGNPFDIVATVTFTHRDSGEQRRTEMFFAGGDQWKFRFTAVRPGVWTFVSRSDHRQLNGKQGVITVNESEGTGGPVRLFITNNGNRWAWSGDGRPFVPRIVMYRDPDGFHQQPDRIDDDLKLWFGEHGFNGLHTAVLCRWFNFDKVSSDEIAGDDPNPDPRTFEALELLIGKAYAAGGFVHMWAWGDESRRMTPTRWGINGKADRRLQRYIAARLGPMPGWTMGYGFDLWEWVNEPQLVDWHNHLIERMFHPHLVGGRVHQHGRPLDTEMTRRLSYVGYEAHRPDYATYVRALQRNPNMPVMMEDRFRVRDSKTYREKDYTEAMTRRGMWHAAMAGGVGNIWGYLLPDAGPHGMSRPYPNRSQLRTHALFFDRRFTADLAPVAGLTDGLCMATADRTRLIFYKEDGEQLQMALSSMPGERRAVAVDALKPYDEIDLGALKATDQTWTAPYRSDWAVSVDETKP